MAASLASATSSRVDSASKHIIPCRTNTDYLASLFDNTYDNAMRELQQNKHKYATAQNDIVIGLGRPMYGSSVNSTRKKAYPSTIATLGAMPKEARLWIAAQNFLVKDYMDVENLKREFCDALDPKSASNLRFKEDVRTASGVLKLDHTRADIVKKIISNMLEMYFVGVSLGLAYAHPSSGDTVASVMIGGLRTVLNGHYQVHTGDLMMFYMDDEKALFEENGGRKPRSMLQDNVTGAASMSKIAEWIKNDRLEEKVYNFPMSEGMKNRKAFYDRENGNYTSGPNGPISGKLYTFMLKPYIVSRYKDSITGQPEHFPYDKFRVFGKAISNAQPFEHVDIMLSRQSI